jgi:hypothetical protein
MAYEVSLTFLVEAESEEILERYVDMLAFDIAEREGFLLDNRTIGERDVHLPGTYRSIGAGDLPYVGR